MQLRCVDGDLGDRRNTSGDPHVADIAGPDASPQPSVRLIVSSQHGEYSQRDRNGSVLPRHK